LSPLEIEDIFEAANLPLTGETFSRLRGIPKVMPLPGFATELNIWEPSQTTGLTAIFPSGALLI
jgi:hypothetical protein